jgi:hypothetical protein
VDPPERLRRMDPHVDGREDVRLRSPGALDDEGGDVPSPRCSRSTVTQCHSLASGSPDTGRAQGAPPRVDDPPRDGALTAARATRSAARAAPGESASSPRICRSAVTLPRRHASNDAAGATASHALGMWRATSPSAKL